MRVNQSQTIAVFAAQTIRPSPTAYGVMAAVIVAIILAIATGGLWFTSERTSHDEMRRTMSRLASAVTATIDPELHDQLRDPSMIDGPLYQKALANLKRARRATTGVKYMYTAVADGDTVRFVLDAADPGDHDGDGREDRAKVWEEYVDPEPIIWDALGRNGQPGHPTASEAPYSDEWGLFVTGYAPFFRSDGSVAGIVGVDVDANEFLAAQAARRRAVALGLIPGGLLVLGVGAGVFLLRRRQLLNLEAIERARVEATNSAVRLADSERRFRSIANSAPMFVWTTGPDATRNYCNEPWLNFRGRSLDQELGDGWTDGIHPDDYDRYHATFLEAFEARRTLELEYRVRRHDGEYRLIMDRGNPRYSANGAFAGYVGACVDVTELHRLRDVAEAANRTKSEFLASMSHEIRAPLTAILGFAELLSDDGSLAVEPERRAQAVQAMNSAGRHLLSLINDILDLSKIEAGRMTVEEIDVDLPNLLFDVESLLRARTDPKGISLSVRLETPIPQRIRTDPTRLRQILLNIAGNAVKFTAQGGVTLQIAAVGQGDAALLQIDVSDTGQGVTPEQADNLFNAFTQADASVTRTHGGTGLGLIISRRLAGLLGGDVKLTRAAPGQGASFRVQIALRTVEGATWVSTLATDTQERVAPPKASITLQGRILLAEDSPDNQRLIAFHLRRAGADVELADNGRIALEKLSAAWKRGMPFDLLITDVQMPEIDGYELAQTLRQHEDNIPIVALTAHAMSDDRAKCEAAGCDDYLPKPIDRHCLLEVCAKWLERGAQSNFPRQRVVHAST